ncbi:MAG: hypothetical protein AAFU85_02275 [Planctomycetota bacterium]
MKQDAWPREKNWKFLIGRSNKIWRANQLGFAYPRKELMHSESLNLLFLCSMNQWRSPTAEKVFADTPLLQVRSRGTSRKARRTVAATDLQWADIVFVMEDKHRRRVEADFPGHLRHKELHVLDIPDEYKFMDPTLVAEIRTSVDAILDDWGSQDADQSKPET